MGLQGRDSVFLKQLCPCTVRDHSWRNSHSLHMRGQELPWPPELKPKASSQDKLASHQVTNPYITNNVLADTSAWHVPLPTSDWE